MSEKKVVKREIAVALGAVCIVLAISMVGAVLYQYSIYNNLQSSYNTLQSNYNDLQSSQSANSAYINDHSHTNEEYESLKSTLTSTQSQLSSTQSQLSSANAIANLQSSSTWLSSATVNQDRGSYYSYTYSAGYAGYVSVYIQSSTTSNQYVEAIWSSNGVDYDKSITTGTSGTAVFPVLPSSNIQIRIGNTNLLNGATATVTITYYY
jgi:hypothetical protein